ncbi:MAG TPA: TIM barrel protein [Chthonomonadales bacterium]|nr:TIM barrel protein [Chthonomonadales bacterium]
MKLGIMLSGRRPDDVRQRLEQAREAGFSLCQINLHQTGFSRADLVAIADAVVEYEVRPVAVGCYVNPLRPDEPYPMGATRADLSTLLHALDIVGARRVVLFSGSYASSVFDDHPDNHTDEALERVRYFVTAVCGSIRARNYRLVIEPWHTHVLSSEKRIAEFHRGLDESTRQHVRYVLDAPALILETDYPNRDKRARALARVVGPAAGAVHFRDCIMPPDGETAYPAPGQGRLDYPAYVEAVVEHANPDAPAVIRNVPAAEFAAVRDYMLRLGVRWELA